MPVYVCACLCVYVRVDQPPIGCAWWRARSSHAHPNPQCISIWRIYPNQQVNNIRMLCTYIHTYTKIHMTHTQTHTHTHTQTYINIPLDQDTICITGLGIWCSLHAEQYESADHIPTSCIEPFCPSLSVCVSDCLSCTSAVCVYMSVSPLCVVHTPGVVSHTAHDHQQASPVWRRPGWSEWHWTWEKDTINTNTNRDRQRDTERETEQQIYAVISDRISWRCVDTDINRGGRGVWRTWERERKQERERERQRNMYACRNADG